MNEAETIIKIIELATGIVCVLLFIWIAYMYWLSASRLKMQSLDQKEREIENKITGMSLNDVVNLNNSEGSIPKPDSEPKPKS